MKISNSDTDTNLVNHPNSRYLVTVKVILCKLLLLIHYTIIVLLVKLILPILHIFILMLILILSVDHTYDNFLLIPILLICQYQYRNRY